MRPYLLPLALLALPISLFAQITAGEVPDGSTAYEVNIDLLLTAQFTSDTAELELDCDDFMDAQAILYRGAPEIDAPHVASLHFVDDNIEVCMDLATSFEQRPKYHAFGEVLDCSGDFDWQLANELVLGDLGGFLGIGPWSVDSMYIAYRQGGAVGWILLSFDLGGNNEVRLRIHEILSVCQTPTLVKEPERTSRPTLTPNPNNGEPIRLQYANEVRYLEVLDPTGRVIAHYNGNTRTIAAPAVAGSYLVRATYADGRRSVARLVRE